MLEVKDQQATITDELQELTIADHKYHLTANSVLRLAKRAGELFTRSSPEEKRELLKMVLSNPRLNGKKLEFAIRSPFDAILGVSSSPIGLPELDAFRTINWKEIENYLHHELTGIKLSP